MRSVTDITAKTKLCAVIGNPIEHSMSPAIHNRAFAELKLDYVYVAFRVEDVGRAIAGMGCVVPVQAVLWQDVKRVYRTER